MRAIVDLLGCKDDEGRTVVYNYCDILEAVDGDE